MLMRAREGARTFWIQHGPFSPHVASQTRIDLLVYIYKKDLHFLNTTQKYRLGWQSCRILGQKLSYDTEGRISCSLLSTRLNSWGSAIIFRLDVEEKAGEKQT